MGSLKLYMVIKHKKKKTLSLNCLKFIEVCHQTPTNLISKSQTAYLSHIYAHFSEASKLLPRWRNRSTVHCYCVLGERISSRKFVHICSCPFFGERSPHPSGSVISVVIFLIILVNTVKKFDLQSGQTTRNLESQ